MIVDCACWQKGMAREELLLTKWRELPLEKQQKVFDFIEQLHTSSEAQATDELRSSAQSALGQKLRQIRTKIVSSGEPLLQSWEEVEREVADRRADA